MSKPNTSLRAIVIGAGYAAEGHTIGLREAGVEIVAPCGRTPEPAYKRATQLHFHGDAGSLYMSGDWSNDHIQHFVSERRAWEEMLIPPEVTAALPPTQDYVQRYWNQFLREFVADVNGEGYAGYPTFRDGCTAVAIMDIARAGNDWTAL